MDMTSFPSSRRRWRSSPLSVVPASTSRRIEASLDLLRLLRGHRVSSLRKQPLFSDISRLAFAYADEMGGGDQTPEGRLPDGTSRDQRRAQIPASVSNDLMRVYENLTRSRTPQTPSTQQQSRPQSSYAPKEEQDSARSSPHHGYAPPTPPPPVDNQPPLSFQIPPPPQYPPPRQHLASDGALAAPPQQCFLPPVQQQEPLPPRQAAYYSHSAPYYQQLQSQQKYGSNQPPHSYITPSQQQSYGAVTQQQQQQQQDMADSQRSQSTEADDTDGNGTDEAASVGPSGRLRRKRRSSDMDNSSVKSGGGGKTRKKSKNADGRWSKRFTWPEELHRDFVSAIFDVGLKHSSPSTILEQMPKHEQITTERIKSHLQKYRIHRAKSKKEFMSGYDSSLEGFKSNGMEGVKSIAGGAVGAHLAYSTLNDTGATDDGLSAQPPEGTMASQQEPTSALATEPELSSADAPSGAPENLVAPALTPANSDALILPQLTDSEKRSPIGAAMGYLMGLFFSLKQQLMLQRAAEAAGSDLSRGGDAPIQAVFNSFNGGYADYTQQQPTESNHALSHTQPPTGTVLSAPSVRTDLGENNLMMREMQSQMATTNKMRELKQQELNKYKTARLQGASNEPGVNPNDADHASTDAAHQIPESFNPGKMSSYDDQSGDYTDSQRGHYQGAGEAAADGSAQQQSGANRQQARNREMSVGGADDFWNTDVVDEHLFEFLMNN